MRIVRFRGTGLVAANCFIARSYANVSPVSVLKASQ